MQTTRTTRAAVADRHWKPRPTGRIIMARGCGVTSPRRTPAALCSGLRAMTPANFGSVPMTIPRTRSGSPTSPVGRIPGNEFRETNQKSAPINLIAGQKYYIEALQKEHDGGDNLAVGWAKPGQDPSSPSEVIPGSVLSPWTGGNLSMVAIGPNSISTLSPQPPGQQAESGVVRGDHRSAVTPVDGTNITPGPAAG